MSDVAANNESTWSRTAWRAVRPALVLYFCVMLLLMIFESKFVYPIPSVERGDWLATGLEHEDVWFESEDGTKLHGWFVPHPSPKRVILYCHGNGEHVGDNADLLAHLRDSLSASVLMFDYRGYGRSQGRPTEAGCIADGLAAQKWLMKKLQIRPDQIVVMGRSLGGAVAVAIVAETGAQALVVENTFPTLPDVASLHYRWLPVRRLMDNRYDSATRVKSYDGPYFQIHGTDDHLIPIDLGRQLFDAVPGTLKQFKGIPNCGHNSPWPASYYWDLAKFLDRVTLNNTTRNGG